MSKVKSFANGLGLKVVSASVAVINPVIFATKVPTGSFGQVEVVDGVPHLIDIKNNTAEPITAVAVKDATIAGLPAAKTTRFQDAAIAASENYGTISEIVFEKADEPTLGSVQGVISFAKANGLKIAEIDVAVQNDVIFSTVGLKSLNNLTEHDGTFYKLDVANNSASVVNAAALSEQAVADFKAMKTTDATLFAEAFRLITNLTLVKKAD